MLVLSFCQVRRSKGECSTEPEWQRGAIARKRYSAAMQQLGTYWMQLNKPPKLEQ